MTQLLTAHRQTQATKNRTTVSPSHAAMGGGLHFDNMAAPSPSTAATEVGRKGVVEFMNLVGTVGVYKS